MKPIDCCGDAHLSANCAGCGGEEAFAYWCHTCKRSVPAKRCPHCGLKAVKKRGEAN